MKKNIITIILWLTIFLTFGQEKHEDVFYVPFPNNEKFEGTYIFEDDQQRFVMTLVNKKRKPIKKGDNTLIDMLEGDISYVKNGKNILAKNKEFPHIQGGIAGRDCCPIELGANFYDQERKQGGTVTLTLDPDDSTAIFKLEKPNRIGDFFFVHDEASRRRAEEERERYKRPFAIPDSLVLKKQ